MAVTSDHPSLTGHFPGDPIVPGVIILQWVAEKVQSRLNYPVRLRRIPVVKFLSPLRPEQRVLIKLDGDGLRVQFRCELEGNLVAQGTMEFEDHPPKDAA